MRNRTGRVVANKTAAAQKYLILPWFFVTRPRQRKCSVRVSVIRRGSRRAAGDPANPGYNTIKIADFGLAYLQAPAARETARAGNPKPPPGRAGICWPRGKKLVCNRKPRRRAGKRRAGKREAGNAREWRNRPANGGKTPHLRSRKERRSRIGKLRFRI